MNLLPKWVLANPFPAIHDFESLTVLEQTARVYGAMQKLIDEYNAFAETVNKQLVSFTDDETEAREEFELRVTKVMNQFMCDMEQYLKINLDDTATEMIKRGIDDGSVKIPTDKTLTMADRSADAKGTGEAIKKAVLSLSNDIAVERERISALTANNESSTAENAELIDIRTAYDGKKYTTAGDAVRAQARIWDVAYPKIPIAWVDGTYVQGASGAVLNNESLSTTDFIDISAYAGMQIEFTCRIGGSIGYAFYDKANLYIAGEDESAMGDSADIYVVKTTVPANAAYIRITAWTGDKDKHYIKSAMSVSDVLALINELFKLPDILLTWVDGTYVQGASGAVLNNASLSTTDFIDISAYAGMQIEFTCRIGGSIGYAFYDKANLYIAGEDESAMGDSADIRVVKTTVPDDAAYIRITAWTEDKDKHYIKPDVSVYEIIKSATKQASRPFKTKIAMFGDSITLGRDGDGDSSARTSNTIPRTVSRMLNVECVNFGVGSMGWIAEGDGMNAYEKISSEDLRDYNVITLCFGVNDHFKTLGAWNSSNEETVMGQVHKCIRYIYEQNPTTRLIVIAPFNGRNVGTFPDYWYGDSWGEIDELLEKACAYYGIPYISQKASPINAFTINTLIGEDGVHPNEEGYRCLGEWISGELRRLIG